MNQLIRTMAAASKNDERQVNQQGFGPAVERLARSVPR
jgi:hypothetical protein